MSYLPKHDLFYTCLSEVINNNYVENVALFYTFPVCMKSIFLSSVIFTAISSQFLLSNSNVNVYHVCTGGQGSSLSVPLEQLWIGNRSTLSLFLSLLWPHSYTNLMYWVSFKLISASLILVLTPSFSPSPLLLSQQVRSYSPQFTISSMDSLEAKLKQAQDNLDIPHHTL